MQSDSLTLYKLIILYILNKVDFPMSNSQISDFILEKDYTNYFSIQQSLSEIIEASFAVMEPMGHNSFYHITESGKETLSFFDHMIPTAIKEDTIEYLKEHQYALRNEVSTRSTYFKSKGEYTVELKVMEKDASIIDLNILVPSEEEAAKICNNWRQKSQQIYAYVLSTLLQED